MSYKKIIDFVRIYFSKYFSKEISILANNLAYVTTLSIFPLFSIILGISKGFGLDEVLINKLNSLISQNETALMYIINIANNMINSAKSGILTGFGMLILIYSVSVMLTMLENTFNSIWNVKKNRKYIYRLINYMALIFILPLFIVLIIASSSFLWDLLNTYLGEISILVKLVISIINSIFTVMFIAAIFILVPNKRVQILPAFIGAFITYIGLRILYAMYYLLQSAINNYNVIYGSLAFIPIFLIMIKYLWTIVLIGSQITYTIQISRELVEDEYTLSISLEKKLSIYVMYLIIKKFESCENPMDISELNDYTGISKKILIIILRNLQNIGFINEFLDEKKEKVYYQVNKNPNVLSVEMLNDYLENIDEEDENIFDNINEDKKEEYIRIIKEIKFNNKKLLKDI